MSTHAAAYENDYEWDPSKSPGSYGQTGPLKNISQP